MRPPSLTNRGPSPRQRMFRKVWTAQPYSAATSVSVSRLPAASLAAGGAGVSGCIVHPQTWPTSCVGTLGMVRTWRHGLLQLQSTAVQLQSTLAAIHCFAHCFQVFADGAAR